MGRARARNICSAYPGELARLARVRRRARVFTKSSEAKVIAIGESVDAGGKGKRL